MRNQVRQLRTERGISQGQLATAMEVSRQTINSIEQERYTPSLPLAIAALIACAGVVQAVRQESWEPIWSIGWLPAIVVAMLWTPRSGKSCWTRLRGVARR